jgi:NTE family protein
MANISSYINRLNLVKQIPIFAKLNWFELQKISRKSIVVEFRKGDTICKEGSPPDFFYCLLSGRLKAYTMNPNGQKENIEFIHRGMHFGIISILTGENHSLNFEAINDSVILKIDKDDFQALLKSIPHLGIELSHSLSKRVRRKVQGSKSIFESTIISIYSPVKGTGSSTYAINLALSLEQETGKKVILVNIHSGQNGGSKAQPSQGETTPRWKRPAIEMNDIVEDHEKIIESIIKNDLKIDLLNVVFDAEDASSKKQISPFVSALVGDYHYVVVDLPNDMDDVVLETLTQSDLVHLITLDRRKDLEFIRRVVDRLELILKENFRVEKIRVIIRAVHDKIYLSFEEINKFIDYDVHTMLPHIDPSELKVDSSSEMFSFYRCQPRTEYAKAVTRIARQIGGVLVGLVLSGGAALGVAHIGVIRVLEEENIPIDIVVGSSMGALIGGLWAVGYNADGIEQIAREFEKKRSMLKLFDPVVPISGLIGGRGINRWLKKHFGNRTFYSTIIPLKIVAYDLIRREEIVINSGPLWQAVRKSVSIPGVIEPVKHKEQLIIDGGVLNPLPTNVLASLGIKKIIAVNVLQSPEDVSSGYDMLQHQLKEQEKVAFLTSPFQFLSFRISKVILKIFNPNISDIIVRTLQATEHVIAEQSAQQADIVIHPDLVGINWFELDKVDELVKRGKDAALNRLAEIKQLSENSTP